MNFLVRFARVTLAVLLVAAVTGAASMALLWRTRASLADIPLPPSEPVDNTTGKVTATWLGISTLLFDDGDTQILTDAMFSRFGIARLALLQPLRSDIARINYMLDEYHINRVETIIPLHSHFDHAMDIGHVANRTDAVILGSESSANIAQGSDVPVDQYQILDFGESRYFGDFTVTLLKSRHVPTRGEESWFPGIIEEPLRQPARIYEWRGGTEYAVLISHPRGTALVTGSAGFVKDALEGERADVAFLSIAGLSHRGQDYARRYWQETVAQTGASYVYPVHFEDFTRPYGELALFPDLVDDVVSTSAWLNDFAASEEVPVAVRLPRFGQPIALY